MKTHQRNFAPAAAVALTTALVAAFATTAQAAPPGAAVSSRSVVVHFAHLDLSREADVRSLYRELRRAAKQACGSYDIRNLAERSDWRQCRDAALDDAVMRVGNDRLRAWHGVAGDGGSAVAPRLTAGR